MPGRHPQTMKIEFTLPLTLIPAHLQADSPAEGRGGILALSSNKTNRNYFPGNTSVSS